MSSNASELMKSLRQIIDAFLTEAEVNPDATTTIGRSGEIINWPDPADLASILIVYTDNEGSEWSMSFDSVTEDVMNSKKEVGH